MPGSIVSREKAGLSAFLPFLSRKLGDERYVYDDEVIHYGILTILVEECREFASQFLGLEPLSGNVAVVLKPHKGIFDLMFCADDSEVYCEVKVWGKLDVHQFGRQVEFLNRVGRRGIYLLMGKSVGSWRASEIAARSGGRCSILHVDDLREMLNRTSNSRHGGIEEIASAYSEVLSDLGRRWPRVVSSD